MSISFATLAELSLDLEKGSLTSTALVEHFLHRIDRMNEKLAAFVLVDHAGALRAAAAADSRRAHGARLGPLDGLPVAVKDMFDVEGQLTTCGSAHWRGRRSEGTATIVDRLRAAGMCILGKTQMVEFAFGAWGTNPEMGTPWNPWDLSRHRIPGGSSSGSAVAVAAGLVPAAVGSDTGGSIRTPAALTGITGLKTTGGLISLHGALTLCADLDTAGPLCRTAEDAALLLAIMAGPDPKDARTAVALPFDLTAALLPLGGLEGERIAVMRESEFPVPVTPAILEAFRETRALLADLGAKLEEKSFPFDMHQIIRQCGVLMAVDGWKVHREYIEDPSLPFGPSVRERIVSGRFVGEDEYRHALALHHELSRRWQRWLAEDTAFLTPALPITACPIEEVDERATPLAAFARAGNFLGACGLSFTAGVCPEGLPIGMQLLAKPFDEAGLIRIGRAFQRRTNWHRRSPDLTSLLQ
jgi:aspartyl-tRNA(Asn)/glutamyl-tRNA(Gln) amidotransferase subunit A